MKKIEKLPKTTSLSSEEWLSLVIVSVNELVDWQNEMVETWEVLIATQTIPEVVLEANTPQEDKQYITSVGHSTLDLGSRETSKVTRLEVIDEEGRVYSRWDARIYLDYQDGGKTLKIFVEQDNGKRD